MGVSVTAPVGVSWPQPTHRTRCQKKLRQQYGHPIGKDHVPGDRFHKSNTPPSRGDSSCRVGRRARGTTELQASSADNAEPSHLLDAAWDGRHTEIYAVRRAAAMWGLVEPIESLEPRLNTCALLLPDLPANIWRMDPTHTARLAASSASLADRLIFLKDMFPGCDVERMVVLSRLKIALEDEDTLQKIVGMYIEKLSMFEADILYRIMEAMPSLLNLEDQVYMAAPQQEAAQVLTVCGPKAEPWVSAILIAKHQITEELMPWVVEEATGTGSPPGVQRLGQRIGQLGTY